MLKTATVVTVCLVVGSTAMAAFTPVQTVGFAGGEATVTGSDSDSSVRASYQTSITGLQKFDPSLGTLTRVLLSIEVNASASIRLYSDGIIDDQALFSLQHVDQGAETFVQTQIGYNYDGPLMRFLAISTGNLGTTGGTGLDPADYSASGFVYTDESSIVYGGFSGGGSTPRTGQILNTDNFYDSTDFVGIGEVTTLSVVSFADAYLTSTSFTIDNLDFADINTFTRVEAGNVTLQYEYAPVPEPASIALSGALLALLPRRRRRA